MEEMMDNFLAYSLSLGGFLSIALWWMLFGGNLNQVARIILCMVFITLGVLSLKYIDVIPLAFVNWFKYPTLIMSLTGGLAMLIGKPAKRKADGS